jgi:hypothetical protein
MNWKELVNGLLLKEAVTAGFEILLTGDTNIYYQQNITGRSISIVVLRAYNNLFCERERMLRLLIEDVTLIKGEEIVLNVRLRGGETRTLKLPRPVPIPELCKKKRA